MYSAILSSQNSERKHNTEKTQHRVSSNVLLSNQFGGNTVRFPSKWETHPYKYTLNRLTTYGNIDLNHS